MAAIVPVLPDGVVCRRRRATEAPEFDLSDPDAAAYCPACGAAHRAGVARCESCDVALVPRTEVPPRPEWGHDESEATVALCSLDDRVKADLLGRGLEEAGIPHLWRSVTAHVFGAPDVLECRVPVRYLEDARAVLRQIDERGRPTEGRANG